MGILKKIEENNCIIAIWDLQESLEELMQQSVDISTPNFNNEKRGLWLPMCIIIFGEQAKIGTFSIIDYRKKT